MVKVVKAKYVPRHADALHLLRVCRHLVMLAVNARYLKHTCTDSFSRPEQIPISNERTRTHDANCRVVTLHTLGSTNWHDNINVGVWFASKSWIVQIVLLGTVINHESPFGPITFGRCFHHLFVTCFSNLVFGSGEGSKNCPPIKVTKWVGLRRDIQHQSWHRFIIVGWPCKNLDAIHRTHGTAQRYERSRSLYPSHGGIHSANITCFGLVVEQDKSRIVNLSARWDQWTICRAARWSPSLGSWCAELRLQLRACGVPRCGCELCLHRQEDSHNRPYCKVHCDRRARSLFGRDQRVPTYIVATSLSPPTRQKHCCIGPLFLVQKAQNTQLKIVASHNWCCIPLTASIASWHRHHQLLFSSLFHLISVLCATRWDVPSCVLMYLSDILQPPLLSGWIYFPPCFAFALYHVTARPLTQRKDPSPQPPANTSSHHEHERVNK